MKKNLFSIVNFVLILIISLNFISAFGTTLKPFEDVITNYGIEKWQVNSEYELIKFGEVSVYEIPIYEFTFIWKVDLDSVWSRTLGRFKKIFHVNKITVKVPAVEMSDEDWKQYGSSFILPVENVAERYSINNINDFEYELTTNNDLPAYSFKEKEPQLTADGIAPNDISVPAIYLGQGTNKKGTFNEQLWKLWNAGGVIQVEEE